MIVTWKERTPHPKDRVFLIVDASISTISSSFGFAGSQFEVQIFLDNGLLME
jgi:hypothetical protein